jgi:hypothetical protein
MFTIDSGEWQMTYELHLDGVAGRDEVVARRYTEIQSEKVSVCAPRENTARAKRYISRDVENKPQVDQNTMMFSPQITLCSCSSICGTTVSNCASGN